MMNTFLIRHSTLADVPHIMEIYAYARQFMAEHGNPNQWGPTNWPPEELIRNDIEEQHSYACICEGRIVGTFYFIHGENIEPTYRDISGQWVDDSAYGVVHRIASDGSKKGIGSFCINWAYEQCGHLRMDTHPDNKVMQKLLTKLGFQQCGVIHVIEDDNPRFAYEKSPIVRITDRKVYETPIGPVCMSKSEHEAYLEEAEIREKCNFVESNTEAEIIDEEREIR